MPKTQENNFAFIDSQNLNLSVIGHFSGRTATSAYAFASADKKVADNIGTGPKRAPITIYLLLVSAEQTNFSVVI